MRDTRSGVTMEEYVLRFFIGGIAVSAFAILGDIFRPKSFAGLFGAAPSIAIATLAIAFWQQGPSYVAIEGRSLVIGALALALYCVAVCQLIKRLQYPALAATGIALIVWSSGAFGLKWLVLG
jgi:Protein of unknown function (DUF3147)